MVAPHMNDVTLILAYYDNPNMLAEQLRRLATVQIDRRAHIGLTVVDDGSPGTPAEDVIRRFRADNPPPHGRLGCGMRLYRMDVDVRWNQDACRNLAAKYADTKWLLMTDMDHIVPPETWERVLAGRLSWKSAYMFSRVTGPTRSARNPHPNSWLLTGDTFEAAGGYDERFAGFYGTDGDFRRRLEKVCKIELLPERLHEITPDMIDDCRTRTYERKTSADREAIPRLVRERAGSKTIRGRFPWHQVM